jgi:DNA-binding transcriptional ArsR family regulator
LSATSSALADPARRSILARLAGGEATVNALAVPFDMSVQAISRHLKVLEAAGSISRNRDAQFRPSRFEAAPLDGALAWIEQTRNVGEGRSEQVEQAQRPPAR